MQRHPYIQCTTLRHVYLSGGPNEVHNKQLCMLVHQTLLQFSWFCNINCNLMGKKKERGTEPAGPMVIHTSNTKPACKYFCVFKWLMFNTNACKLLGSPPWARLHVQRQSTQTPALQVRHRGDVRCIEIFGTTVRCACGSYSPRNMRIKIRIHNRYLQYSGQRKRWTSILI